MEKKEIEVLLDEVKKAQTDKFKGVEEAIEKLKTDASTFEEKARAIEEVKTALEQVKKNAEDLAVELKKNEKKAVGKVESFVEKFANAVAENAESIKNVSQGKSATIELKSVGTMTISNNVTGAGMITYANQPALAPLPFVNFRDLVPGITSATGIYSLYRGNGIEGSISSQSTPGNPKTQIDFDYLQATYTARYLAGFARVDKSMMQDLTFLQSALPYELTREFLLAENAKFYTDLTGVVTGSTTIGANVTNLAEAILAYVANLMKASYMPNGIVLNPAEWAELLATSKGTGYGMPGGITVTPTGGIAIAGIPVIPAYWVPAGKVIVGDWTRAKRVEVDGLRIEFFEQDSDNVQRNLVTARIECREVLAIERLDAFVFADTNQWS